MEYCYRLRCGKYGYNWFNLGLNSRNKCPSICCASCTSREDLEIDISPIVVPYRSTPPPFFVDGNCVDGNWLPTVLTVWHFLAVMEDVRTTPLHHSFIATEDLVSTLEHFSNCYVTRTNCSVAPDNCYVWVTHYSLTRSNCFRTTL